MGEDSVIECVKVNNEVKVYTSVTRAAPGNYGARRNIVSQKLNLTITVIISVSPYRIKISSD